MSNERLLQKLASMTDVPTSRTTYLTHSIHPYPAKFIPCLPERIILECTKERNVVLDPFCGSGTTLLEAAINGRKSIGVDSNPIATLISKAKTQYLTDTELQKLEEIKTVLSNIDLAKVERKWIPDEKNLKHWFNDSVITELSWLKNYIETNTTGNLQTFLLCIFSSIIVTVSNQESNTRYAAKYNNISKGGTIVCFLRKLKAETKKIIELSNKKEVQKNTPKVITKNINDISNEDIPDNSVDIIITSPPYANSYDYYLYHKWRMIWLGYDYNDVKNNEIGSRNEHSSRKAPLSAFENKMIGPMKSLSRVLKPNKLAFFFIGDSIINGELINMSDCFKRIAEVSGFSFVCEVEYSLPKVSKSFLEKKNTSKAKASEIDSRKMQRILVFQPKKTVLMNDAMNDVRIATPHSSYDLIDLDTRTPEDNTIVSLVRKEKDLSVHTIGKYPAKYIPDIPRWAILNYSKPGDLVLDPFNGSGTTTVEASYHNRNSIGIDVSPYACLLARAKQPLKNKTSFIDESKAITDSLNSYDSSLFVERKHFDNDLFWFPESNLFEFEYILQKIQSLSSYDNMDYFLAILSMVVKPCSYLDESQIKVKRDQKKLLNGVPSPISLFPKLLERYAPNRINNFIDNNNNTFRAEIINESVLNLGDSIKDDSVDLIVTSPPYINAMNYPMNHRYESFLLGLIKPEESIKHQQAFIGTERVFAQDYNRLHLFDSNTYLGEELNEKLDAIFKLEPKRSYITYRYFKEMHEVFSYLYKKIKIGGRLTIVAGTNTIKGIPIDTFEYLIKDMRTLGFDLELCFKYDIINNALKISRHKTSNIIKLDGVAVLKK